MKTIKTLLLTLALVFFAVSCSARDNFSHDVNVLPETARTFISTHFPDLQVSHIKIDKHLLGGDEYEVVLTNGTEVDFDSKGKLESVDCGRMGKVPESLVNKSVSDYVARTYKGQNIVSYDVKRNGYEVELQSGLELLFNSQGQFQRIDD